MRYFVTYIEHYWQISSYVSFDEVKHGVVEIDERVYTQQDVEKLRRRLDLDREHLRVKIVSFNLLSE